jgi:hypothetical protein
MLPRAEADYLVGRMSSTNAEPSPSQKSSPALGFPALLAKLDWKKDKKRILLIAGGAVLAVVIALLLPSPSGYSESQMKSNPIQALANMAAKMRPDLDLASVDGARQTVTLKDKNGALSTFKFDPQTKTLIPVPAVQAKMAETQPPPVPVEQPASTPLGSMPEWMPVYPTTIPEIASSVVTPEGDKQTVVTFKSDDKPTEIVRFYQTKLQESGFEIEVASSGDQGGMIQAHDAEKKRMLILNVNPEEIGTLSRVVTVQKK